MPIVKATINAPISEIEVTLDGVVDYIEWSDAYHIQLNSFDAGYFDFYIKYDNYYEELQIGFIADDSNYDEVDRIIFFFDTGNNGGINTDIDDFALIIYRQTTTNYGFYEYPVDSLYLEGTGSGFFTGASHYDASILPYPFGWFNLEKGEINPGIDLDKGGAYGDSWEGEFSIGLSKTYVQDGSGISIGFGLGYYNFDYNGTYIEGRLYPSEFTEQPSTWDTLIIQYSEPMLSISSVSPTSKASYNEYPINFRARATSNGLPVFDAIVDFYVDGNLVGYDYTDIDGYADYDYYPSEGPHNWYIAVEKNGYIGASSDTLSFTYSNPTPILTIPQMSPRSGTTVYSPIQLEVSVTSDGVPIEQARVDFYVGGEYVGYDTTDNSGYAAFPIEVNEGLYSWYAIATKNGFIEGISALESFSYEIQRYYLTIISEVYVQGEGNYEDGYVVTLSAYDVVENYLILKIFDSWLIDGVEYSTNSVSFSMGSNTTVYAYWHTDYTRVYLAVLLGFVVLVLVGYFNSLNKRRKAAEEKKLVVETELRAVKEKISRKLETITDAPIELLREVNEHVTVEDVKKILEEVVSENNITGWYNEEYQYITNKILKNMLIDSISDSLDLNEPFDIALFAKKKNLEPSIILEMIKSLIKEEVLLGYLSGDDKFISEKVLKEKISGYLNK